MHRINNYKKHNSKAVIENGITLIALIITIIVMLILATVVVTGAINGGLFGYAKTAKDNTEIASEKEGIEKAYIIAQGTSKYGTVSETEFQKALDKVMGEDQAEVMANGKTFVIKIGERYYEIDKKGKISDTIEYAGDKTLAEYIAEINGRNDNNGGDENEDGEETISLPDGWIISKTIPTEWDENKVTVITDGTNVVPLPKEYSISDVSGEQAVETGLVIKDNNGNEFVWIPIEEDEDLVKSYNANDYRREPIAFDEIVSQSNSEYDSQETLDYLYGKDYFDYLQDFNYAQDYLNMVNSVNKYRGFYIGRYETTIDENGNIGSVYNTKVFTANNIMKEGKSDHYGWPFYYYWYGQYYAQKMTKFVQGNGTKVQTMMISGQLWDETMEYIDNKTDYTINIATPSWHQGTEVANSGKANEGDVALNIYDLESNAFEWTLEATTHGAARVKRGGCYNNSCSASDRITSYSPINFDNTLASRLILYVK